MIIITKILSSQNNIKPNLDIYLTAEERQKSRQLISVKEGQNSLNLQLKLPRGFVLQAGNLLASEKGDFVVKVCAKKEQVLTITSNHQLDLIKAAYHLGNRHVSLEINEDYLRLLDDPILAQMLTNLGLNIKAEFTPFYPEIGAYHHQN